MLNLSPFPWNTMLFILVLQLFGVFRSCGAVSRPHIVFILADDLGHNDIGYYAKHHESAVKTPFLDDLARKGVILDNYYVQPVCTPSRSQLMSGRYQIHTGLQHDVIFAGQPNALPLDNKIIPEQLRHCGYDTHMIGKWHLGFYRSEFLPHNRGFNSFFGYLNGAEDYYSHVSCWQKACGYDIRSENGPVSEAFGEYSAFTYSKKAKEVIDKRDKSKPLFLYLAFQSVHFPVEVPKQYLQHYHHIKDKTRRVYAGMVAALDEAVGNVTKHLSDAGILDDTIIVFSTDNGGHPLFGGNNWPLRGRKATLWEGGIRGVGFVSGKRLGIADSVSSNLMHISDWFPTILRATDCTKLNNTQPLDGVDQWDAILQRRSSPRKEILHNIDPLSVVRSNASVVTAGFDTSVRAAIRSGPWKLLTGNPGDSAWTRPPEAGKNQADVAENLSLVKLYHIQSDPYERNDLSSHFPDVVMKLLERLTEYNKSAVPVRFPDVDPFSNPKYHGGYWGPWAN